MKKLFLMLCFITVNLSAIENGCFSLAKKAKEIMNSPEANVCFDKIENKKTFSIFIGNYISEPEAYFIHMKSLQLNSQALPLQKEIMKLIIENLEWTAAHHFGLEEQKIKITEMKKSKQILKDEIARLEADFEINMQDKIESSPHQDLVQIRNKAIAQAATVIKNLLDQ